MSTITGILDYLEWKDAVSCDTQAQRGARLPLPRKRLDTLLLSGRSSHLASRFKKNLCRLVWIKWSCFVLTVMKGVVRSAPCAALRLGAQGQREETLRSIRRAERLVHQSHVQSLDSTTRYRTPPFSSKLPDLTLLAHSVEGKQHDDEIKTRPKSSGTVVRLPVHRRFH